MGRGVFTKDLAKYLLLNNNPLQQLTKLFLSKSSITNTLFIVYFKRSV